jgi:hypothetical protein
MNKDALPNEFWHCTVSVPGVKAAVVQCKVIDLKLERLLREVVEPWHAGRAFTVDGRVIRHRDDVKAIRIQHTNESVKSFQARFANRRDLYDSRNIVPATDYTHLFLFSDLKPGLPLVDEQLVTAICERLPKAAKVLAKRRGKKPTFQLKDEYDVQDLLNCLLRAYLKFSVQEDPIGKIAGTNSSRADISVEEIGVLIEVKFVRSPQNQREFVRQFSEDLVLYTKWAPLKTLLYVVYNSSELPDSEALLKLDGEHIVAGKVFRSKMILI